MILKSLKTYFFKALEDYYPETEVQSFFNLLTEDILKMKRMDVALNLYAVVSGKKYAKYENAVKQLQKHRPIQYIIGNTEFYGLEFNVNEHTLIPRPETEELVEWIVNSYSKKCDEPLKILDIGTGSGAIAIALANQFKNAKVYALDVSEDALKVANKNAKLNQVEITFIHDDILNFRKSELNLASQSFDVIVSNPPYVRQIEKTDMHSNVLDNEPHLALFVENNRPLLFYEIICEFSHQYLNRNGYLFFEINEYLGQEMLDLLKSNNYTNIELKKDLFGKDRMIKGLKTN